MLTPTWDNCSSGTIQLFLLRCSTFIFVFELYLIAFFLAISVELLWMLYFSAPAAPPQYF